MDFPTIQGTRVLQSIYLTLTKSVQTKFPRRHKKKNRVVKKFKKLYTKTFQVPDTEHIYRLGNGAFIMHPIMYMKLLELEGKNEMFPSR
jgi:hypothetical protein